MLYSFRTFTFSPNETINQIKFENFTNFVKEYQPNFDRETGGMINLEDFVTERQMLGPRLLLLKRISKSIQSEIGFKLMLRARFVIGRQPHSFDLNG